MRLGYMNIWLSSVTYLFQKNYPLCDFKVVEIKYLGYLNSKTFLFQCAFTVLSPLYGWANWETD